MRNYIIVRSKYEYIAKSKGKGFRMARKSKKAGKANESEVGFSVILGTGMAGKEKAETKDDNAGRKGEKEPVAEKPADAPKTAEPASPEELLLKKQEIEIKIASLNEARSTSKLPSYSYNRMKKMYEAELARINTLLKGGGKPVQAEAKAPRAGTAGQADRKKPGPEDAVPGPPDSRRIMELIRRVERMETVHGMMPSLKSQLASLKSKMNEHQKVVNRLRYDEQALAQELPHVKRSLAALKARRRRRKAMQAVPPREPGPGVDAVLEIVSKKVETLARKLTETFDALNSRIDQVSVMDEVEMKGYVKEFMKKEDLKKLMLQPFINEGEEHAPAPKKEKAKARKTDTVGIRDLEGHIGKDVTIECSLSLLKSVKEKGMPINWYRMKDGTGESVLTSPKEIKEKKARLKGNVKKTKTGSVYVLFKQLAP
jgi:hypothetical protein